MLTNIIKTTLFILYLKENKYFITDLSEEKMTLLISDMTNLPNIIENGVVWLSIYPIIEIESIEGYTEGIDNLVKFYMAAYGIDNVRGGSYYSIDIDVKKINRELEIMDINNYYTKWFNTNSEIDDELNKLVINNKEISKLKRQFEPLSEIYFCYDPIKGPFITHDYICNEEELSQILQKEEYIFEQGDNIFEKEKELYEQNNKENLQIKKAIKFNILENSIKNLIENFYEENNISIEKEQIYYLIYNLYNDYNLERIPFDFDDFNIDIKLLFLKNYIFVAKEKYNSIIEEYGNEIEIIMKIKLLLDKKFI